MNVNNFLGVKKDSTPFTPFYFGVDLRLWFNPSDPTTVNLDGILINQIDDISGNNNNGTSASFRRPEYISNEIIFPAGSDTISISNSISHSDFNLFLVSSYSANALTVLMKGGDRANHPYVSQDGGTSTTITNNYGTPDLYVDGTLETPTNRGDVYNILNTGLKQIQVHQGADTSVWSGTTIMGDYGFGWGIVGTIADLIIVSGVITNSERQKMEGYLAHKHGLTANLPALHPYKTVAP